MYNQFRYKQSVCQLLCHVVTQLTKNVYQAYILLHIYVNQISMFVRS